METVKQDIDDSMGLHSKGSSRSPLQEQARHVW
jgi:hypothetical protein